MSEPGPSGPAPQAPRAGGISETWARVLGDLERRLDAAEATLAQADAHDTVAAVPGFEPPAVAGPIPDALVPRAEALARRGADLERRLGDEAARIRSELRRLPRGANRTPGGSPYRIEIGA